jgi:hypothetical protein
MVEYGQGVGQATGAGGGVSHGATHVDVGTQIGRFINDSVTTISHLPPEILIAGIVAIFLGLVILRRAF